MPKRNKSKDNPYTLDFDEISNIYTVEFTDNKKIIHKVEISEEVYHAFDKFELEDISQIHKYRSHIEHSEVYEDSLNNRRMDKPLSLEEEVNSLQDELNRLNEFKVCQKCGTKVTKDISYCPDCGSKVN